MPLDDDLSVEPINSTELILVVCTAGMPDLTHMIPFDTRAFPS